MLRQRQWCRIAALAVLLLLPACREEESRWDAVQEATEGQTTSTVEDAIDGSVFNQFFPKQGEGFDIVFKQEKEGFAQASLQEGGKELAVFSIFDTTSNPDARTKYASSAEQVAGFPVVTEETKSLSALVGDRYQVQVRSVDPSFGESDRLAWLEKFDLKGISEIE